MGIPVVISQNGFGTPVYPVESNAPSMVVAENGFGIPIVISDLGQPFIVEGYSGGVGVWVITASQITDWPSVETPSFATGYINLFPE